MIRVGMVDRWLDNWHTSHYPDYLRLAAEQYGFDLDITDVWVEQDAPGGMSTAQWCKSTAPVLRGVMRNCSGGWTQ